MKAIILSGGGARGAYQAGVISAVAEISQKLKIDSPFKIYTGISAGAINASFMAAQADNFFKASKELVQLWSQLKSNQVFKTDAISLGKIGLSWVGELSFGGLTGANQSRSLLDTTPLAELLKNNLNYDSISKQIQNGNLHALGVTSLDYKTSETITFVEGQKNILPWNRSRRKSEFAKITADHIVSSSAIPLLFMPGHIEDRFFGDGCIRNQMPLSPALHLGATEILVIGVRKQAMTAYEAKVLQQNHPPSVARVVNVLLNSVLLDGIEIDIERLEKINEFLKRVPSEHHEKLNFKPIKHLFIHPSEDIGEIAANMSSKLPRVIRYLLKGLGPLEDAAEIISYLMFEPPFCQKLIEIGYQDGISHEDEIKNFLEPKSKG